MSTSNAASAPRAELVRLIGVQQDLVRAICTFNQNPADYIDESRRRPVGVPAGSPSSVTAHSRSHRRRALP